MKTLDGGDIVFDTLRVGTLSAANGTSINLEHSLIPIADNTVSIGTQLKRIGDIHNLRNFISPDDGGTAFTTASNLTLAPSVLTDINLTITSNQFRHANGRSFKLPQKGWYTMSFFVDFDRGLNADLLRIDLYNEDISEMQQREFVNENSFVNSTFTFTFWGNSLTDRFTLRALNTSGNNVTNFKIQFGRLMLASSYQ